MTELLDLIREGRAWSIEDLAAHFHTTPDDIRRQMEFLEHTGCIRRVTGCGHNCQGCASYCSAGINPDGFPAFWEILEH